MPAAPSSLRVPPGLGRSASSFWRRHAGELSGLGLLTSLDTDSFRALAEAFGLVVDSAALVHDHGIVRRDDAGQYRTSAAFVAFRHAVNLYRLMAADFGMNPRARAALSVPGEPEQVLSLAEVLFQAVGDGDK